MSIKYTFVTSGERGTFSTDVDERCETLKFSGHDGMLTIRDSLKKHLAMVEIDKQKMQNKDKIVNLECQLCDKSTLVPAKYISQWECQNCKHIIDTI